MQGIDLYAPKQSGQRLTWTPFAFAVTFIAIAMCALVGIRLIYLFDWEHGEAHIWPALSVQLVTGFGMSAVLILIWAWFYERRGFAANGLNQKGLTRFGRGWLIGVGFALFIVAIAMVSGVYEVEHSGFRAEPSWLGLIPFIVLLFGFVVQGSTEEILMRGYLMSVLASRHGLMLAVTLNSAFYTLLHSSKFSLTFELVIMVFNILLLALFISLYAIREHSIWGICGWHTAWNWLLGVGFGFDIAGRNFGVEPLLVDLKAAPGQPWWLTGGAVGPEGSVITSLVLAAGIGWLLWQGGWRIFRPSTQAV
ncbi:type II CAAX endopeptidase family protein [Asticcacaulis sp. SL142]|uniref:CPBP family intramembrane glutamic endopeptidase n=1 Tax=Asticcacaulis sp. SL142 TaxID=2995155 RepID=UPI00226CC7DE|nr:type II CAAX endopeptidase family protein [Asticcacaulis sp. SL142]WAC49221.1 type II CAAX endopeptidase family protein [Asticcacaulis sp. SL142]